MAKPPPFVAAAKGPKGKAVAVKKPAAKGKPNPFAKGKAPPFGKKAPPDFQDSEV